MEEVIKEDGKEEDNKGGDEFEDEKMDKYGDHVHQLGEVEGTRGEGQVDRQEGGKIGNVHVLLH